jgi:hypothetical protein
VRKHPPTGDLHRVRDTRLVVDHNGEHFVVRMAGTPQELFHGRYQVVDALVTGFLWGQSTVVRVLTATPDARVTCTNFRPDHNGECLNCNGWADDHDVPREPGTRRDAFRGG